jgi:hypothetical protein
MHVSEFEGNADVFKQVFAEKRQNCCSHMKKLEEE